MSNNWIAFSATLNIILLFWSVMATRYSLSIIKENIFLRDKAQRLDAQNVSFRIESQVNRITRTPDKKPQSFDVRTTSLLNLAVKNANENEARTAALKACKLIHKKLNG